MTPDLRDLDRAIAEARGETHFCPTYSTDPAWTLRLLEEMGADGTKVCLVLQDGRAYVREIVNTVRSLAGDSQTYDVEPLGHGDNPPEAVARAWLVWHEATKSPVG